MTYGPDEASANPICVGWTILRRVLTDAEDEHLTVVRTEEEALSFLGLRDAAP
jgi:hypothetical protein